MMRCMLIAMWAVALATPAGAATIKAMDLDALAAGADRVITGQVKATKARWADSLIITEVEVEVGSCLVGPCEGTVTVEVIGGQVGDLVMVADGMPRFEAGEEVLLFLQRAAPTASPRWQTRGMAQGKFSVRRAGAKVWLERDLDALELVGDGAPAALALEGVSLTHLTQRLAPLRP